ncbi:glycosyltransferase [Pseudofrankia sp. EUN1h]|uniref:glycosyltransferase n=1 Tax=Pseudofrankia sp. EUN1h TaxID=1834515 RepID=UPI0002FA8666|nr:glycosyltransferase [Pseudofrankia sp. EUN1h]OHV40697.1 hypothetical protein BCD49_09275 [Pseudofrankia sp. EUN1h]
MLLLAPSVGLGGGVERYLAAVEERLRAGGALVHRVDLHSPARPHDPWARQRFAASALRVAARLAPLDAVLTGGPGLIPVAAAAVVVGRARRGPVMVCDADGIRARWFGRALLAHRRALFPLTTGSYSAGALASLGAVPVLRPGVTSAWRSALLAAGARTSRDSAAPRTPTLLTVLPFAVDSTDADAADAADAAGGAGGAHGAGDGLPTLLAALRVVRQAVGTVRLVVAVRGRAPEAARAAVAAAGDAELLESPDDSRLAALYAGADLFVLCTGARPGRGGADHARVLTEAQLAGCPVVGPVRGDARDAYVDGATGVTPGDESPAALAAVLTDLLADRARLARMRRRAAEWARMATEPAEHTRAVFAAVLGTLPAAPAPFPAAAGVPSDGPERWAMAPASAHSAAMSPVPASGGVARPPTHRAATRVWPEPAGAEPRRVFWSTVPPARVAHEVEADPDYAELSRGWSEDIEVDDLRIR